MKKALLPKSKTVILSAVGNADLPTICSHRPWTAPGSPHPAARVLCKGASCDRAGKTESFFLGKLYTCFCSFLLVTGHRGFLGLALTWRVSFFLNVLTIVVLSKSTVCYQVSVTALADPLVVNGRARKTMGGVILGPLTGPSGLTSMCSRLLEGCRGLRASSGATQDEAL